MTDNSRRTTHSSFGIWLHAMRLRSLPLALASIILGTALAAAEHAANWAIFALAALTAALLQVLSNLANDYGDTQHGADHSGRQGPERAVASGAISPSAMRRAIAICALLAALSGLALIAVALEGDLVRMLVFVVVGGAAISAAITYTMGRYPYGYAGFGDIMVLAFFGWAGVVGTLALHTRALDLAAFLPATSVGLLAVGVLNVNNTRDIESDRLARKITIPVRLGARGARLYHWALIGLAFICAALFVALDYRHPAQLLFVLTLPPLWRHGLAVWHAQSAEALDPQLKRIALLTLLFALTLGAGQIL